MRVLVTGGAGFIGRHLVDALTRAGHGVVVLDNRDPRIHPSEPRNLNPDVTYVWKDVRNREAVREAASGAEALVHLASLIEVAEGEREIGRYVDVNVRGTAVLLDTLLKEAPSIQRMILTSSVAVYGEGAYTCPEDGDVEVSGRPTHRLERGQWDVSCPICGGDVKPQGTSEEKRPQPISVYGVTKLTQEKLFEAASAEGSIPAIILRFGNVFGPGQRAEAYAGVTTTFLRRVMAGERPIVHEDGEATRDYLAVEDAVQAALLALESPVEGVWIGNIGSGRPTTVREVAEAVGEAAGVPVSPRFEGTYRSGDIRHLWLDVRNAKKTLAFEPSIGLGEGLRRMLAAS
ncbi:MAG: NAD-dependent epimerase/dehydratase family protein [Thermoplasmata archaeon]